jgi:predicted adenine nucleotide alpha hydrolase (AANH) superfamily ATPase
MWMIENYKDFKEFLSSLTTKPKLLLHACCGPCSTHTIALLNKYFDITVFYDNSNIDTLDEFNKRLEELKKVIKEFEDIKLVVGDYLPQEYFEVVKGLEHLGEFSNRCYKCMELRMKNTYNYAVNNNFDYYTTTLSISPYKNSTWINEIGYRLASDGRVMFLYSNFKKEEGYKNSIKMSIDLNLYRQHYCGCIFSKKELEDKNNG